MSVYPRERDLLLVYPPRSGGGAGRWRAGRHVGDYVTWLTVEAVTVGAALVLTMNT